MFKYVFVGPEKWGEDFPVANGPRQSPINIVPKEAQYDSTLKSLKLKYDPSNAKGILNNGHSFQVDYEDDANNSSKFHRSASSVRTLSHRNIDMYMHFKCKTSIILIVLVSCDVKRLAKLDFCCKINHIL